MAAGCQSATSPVFGILCLMFTFWIWWTIQTWKTVDTSNQGERENTTDSLTLFTHGRPKRWITEDDTGLYNNDINLTHIYMTNSWYRYANMVARSANRSSCYVCTMMPQSSSHHRLTIMPLNVPMSSCVSEFS